VKWATWPAPSQSTTSNKPVCQCGTNYKTLGRWRRTLADLHENCHLTSTALLVQFETSNYRRTFTPNHQNWLVLCEIWQNKISLDILQWNKFENCVGVRARSTKVTAKHTFFSARSVCAAKLLSGTVIMFGRLSIAGCRRRGAGTGTCRVMTGRRPNQHVWSSHHA